MNGFSVFCSCQVNENAFLIGTFKIEDELFSNKASKNQSNILGFISSYDQNLQWLSVLYRVWLCMHLLLED